MGQNKSVLRLAAIRIRLFTTLTLSHDVKILVKDTTHLIMTTRLSHMLIT